MNTRNVFVFLLGAAAAVFVVKLLSEQSQEAGNSHVVKVVEETLHKHEGEDSPIVHAFEAALEKA